MVFGLAGQASIVDAVTGTGRDQFVLVGMETDVCIAHSAIGLLALGHRVAVIDDATASPPPHHDYGIARPLHLESITTRGPRHPRCTHPLHMPTTRRTSRCERIRQRQHSLRTTNS
jgi:hypothetical protein